MKTLTKSDEANISAFKALINMLGNDIKDIKAGQGQFKGMNSYEKANQLFDVHRRRAELIANASKNYPHVNFISECIGVKTEFEEKIMLCARVKAMDRLKLN
jgi:hypothetical protein